ncbi:RIP metalloprotease RseP [Aquimarina sp. 2201CG5-10]|uniref:RIP metalloprotease RseP n=1 Tax=Aquimarina callyspongiae TaxID=3098150 RepID=UPI002AB5BABE|nr:RIP metalloprotease RseP [Aquimarina sp. 2201CG5-10]MDY8137050.1 RIP metalloprotease RseP [Aquimarina sp. 2201CG5-10]
MSPFFVKAIQLLLSLSFLIILHELGHFIPAKLFKTRVEKFYLFFDVKFSLFKKKIGETVYGIGWLPLGGYVKISGMIDESMDKEQMAGPPQPWEFRSKPAWQRLIIMLGGVTVNIILGVLIYILIIFSWGQYYSKGDDIKYGFGVTKLLEDYGFQQGDKIVTVNGESLFDDTEIGKYLMVRDVETVTVKHPNGQNQTIQLPEDIGTQIFKSGQFNAMTFRYPFKLDSIAEGGPAAKAGLLKTDKILKIGGMPIQYQTDFSYALNNHRKNDSTAVITYERNGITNEVELVLGEDKKIGVVMVATDKEAIKQHKVDYSFGESISKGLELGYWTLNDYIAQFKYVFTKEGATQVGGFGAIGNLFPDAWNWKAFWGTTAFISIILAFMNILPIPALDGGHVMFLLYEIIAGRKPNDKFMEYAQLVGFIILIALLLFANGNDIYRAIFK